MTMKADRAERRQDATTAAAEFSAAVAIARALARLSPDARTRVLTRVLQESAAETESVARVPEQLDS
jgi:hypothetical protein